MLRHIIILGICLTCRSAHSQDVAFARKAIDTLTSKYFFGRGYVNNGMKKAADFLAAEFKSYGLQPLAGKKFYQSFSYPVNTFPGMMEVIVNGKPLRAGFDFIVSPESKGTLADAVLVRKDSAHFFNTEKKIMVSLENKLTWSVADRAEDYTSIILNKKSFAEKPSSISVAIENKFNKNFSATNVCGLVKGTDRPDSVLVITAHYDHLGGMGSETFFPGANDDASGVALLLALAKHYAKNPARYSVAFISFAGEEGGLHGSKYFSENPLFPLNKTRFLTNLDLVGTGDEGITVVNASIFKKEFALLNSINDQGNYLVKIKSRGKAANSDHYWFTEKGVPSFFIYALGGIQAYHDMDDKSSTLPLTEFEDLFRLVVRFNELLIQK
jgi:aminopeptidase YwaD